MDAFLSAAMKIFTYNTHAHNTTEEWIIDLKRPKNTAGERCYPGVEVIIYNRPILETRFIRLLNLVSRFVHNNGTQMQRCEFDETEAMIGDEFMVVLKLMDLTGIPYRIEFLSEEGIGWWISLFPTTAEKRYPPSVMDILIECYHYQPICAEYGVESDDASDDVYLASVHSVAH